MKQKKAEMGVGTLIVFIAMLLVAAVAAGVLIQTAGSLQEKSLSTGQQARAQISTNARVIEVSGSDGRNGNLTDFQQIIKLSPGSDAIKLDQIIFTFNTKDQTCTLKYKGVDGLCDKNNVDGYNTWNEETIDADVGLAAANYTLEEDLDDDGADDIIYLYDDAGVGNDYVYVALSSGQILNASLGVDITSAAAPANVVDAVISNGTDTFGYVTVQGSIGPGIINGTTAIFSVMPYAEGEGYFVAIYEQTGTNHVPGNLQRGDVLRLCYESPGQIVEDEQIRLNFIPKIGTPTLTQFVTPDVISTERVYLYP